MRPQGFALVASGLALIARATSSRACTTRSLHPLRCTTRGPVAVEIDDATCTTLDATVTRQRAADMWRDDNTILKASARLDCRVGDITVRGRVHVSHCRSGAS